METLKIDFVSDVACPWCAIGLASLEKALASLDGEVNAELHFQPYELNPDMGRKGEDATEYITKKYGATAEQQAATRAGMHQRGADVGFEFNPAGRGRIWNTFDAHRLIHWAGLQGTQHQLAMKKALLTAYHGRGQSPADAEVLIAAVTEAGLDADAARKVLASEDYASEVRMQEGYYMERGISGVPAVIINDRHLITGGQPPEVFAQALRQIAAATA